MVKNLLSFVAVFLCVFLATNNATAQVTGTDRVLYENTTASAAGVYTIDNLKTYINSGATGGTLTTISADSSLGLSAIILNPTSTPVLRLKALSSYNGILKSTNGTVSQASAGSDYLAPFASQTANQIFAAPNGSTGVPSFRAIVAADIPLLNQSTSGNATTATTATSATTATTAGNVTGTVAILNGGTGSTTQNFVDLTNAQASIAGAKTFTGGLTSSGTTAISAALVEAPSTLVTTTGTIGTSTAQMPLSITANSTLTITAGAATGTLMDCIMIPNSTAQVIFTTSASETFNGNATFTVVAGSQNTTVKFYKYSSTAWRVSLIQ